LAKVNIAQKQVNIASFFLLHKLVSLHTSEGGIKMLRLFKNLKNFLLENSEYVAAAIITDNGGDYYANV